MRRPAVVLSLFLALALGASTRAEQVDVKADFTPLARQLTHKLGAKAYEDREAATRLLAGLGQHAVPALQRAAESEDPEIRHRASRLLMHIRYGATAAWPKRYRQGLRDYAGLPEYERQAFLADLADAFSEDDQAVPFIVHRVLEGDEDEAEAAFEALRRIGHEAAGRAVLREVGSADGPWARRLRAWGLERTGRPLEAYLVLADLKIPDRDKEQIAQAVGDIQSLMRDAENAAALVKVRKLRERNPESLRLVYLEALLARRLGNAERADELLEQARDMHPATKRPHYLAGRMLSEMGLRRLAEPEWRAVLKLQPREGAYTIYAMLGLAADSAAGGRYRRASELLAEALQTLIDMRDSNHPMGILGVEIARVQQAINELRALAVRYGDEDQTPVENELPRDELRALVSLEPTEPKPREQRLLAEADLHVRLQDVPPEFDLEAMPPVLDVDPRERTVEAVFAGVPAAPAIALPHGDIVDAALHLRDRVFLFRVNVQAARAERLGSLTWKATLRLRAGPILQVYEDVVVHFRGETHTWAEATAGLPIPWPSEEARVVVEGTAPSGQRNRSEFTLDLEPPEILWQEL